MQRPLNTYIDHTLLRQDATFVEIEQLCRESVQYRFASVCLHPTWVFEAKRLLDGSEVKVCSVIGFPLGANTSEAKAEEARVLAKHGVDELDMVINIGALKSKDYDKVRTDIEGVVKAAPSLTIKVILETCLLTDNEKQIGCLLALEAEAHFVKTSTGFSQGGATPYDVALLKDVVGTNLGVKASGGIRDLATMQAMLKAGATRIGTSWGVSIMKAVE